MYIHALILSYAYLDVIQKKLKESEKLAETKPRTPGLGCQCSATELRQSDNCTGGAECFTLDAWFEAYYILYGYICKLTSRRVRWSAVVGL